MTSKISSGVRVKYGLDGFKKNWFTENGNLEETFAWSILIKNIIHHEKSRCEDILAFESERFGRCLALDNYIQCTEADEFVLNEMIAFLPLNSHPHPCTVLVVGGGNAGIVREANKHPYVEKIVLCEPDEVLLDVCKKHVPYINKGLQSSKLKIFVEDVTQYLTRTKDEFDVIITDLPDATESAASIIESLHFKTLIAALKPGGVLVSQAECFWFDVSKSNEFLAKCRSIFPVIEYATTFVPSVPGGQRGIVLCGTSPNTNFKEPIHKFTDGNLRDYNLRYYTPDIHRAAFVLPLSIKEDLGLKLETSLN